MIDCTDCVFIAVSSPGRRKTVHELCLWQVPNLYLTPAMIQDAYTSVFKDRKIHTLDVLPSLDDMSEHVGCSCSAKTKPGLKNRNAHKRVETIVVILADFGAWGSVSSLLQPWVLSTRCSSLRRAQLVARCCRKSTGNRQHAFYRGLASITRKDSTCGSTAL